MYVYLSKKYLDCYSTPSTSSYLMFTSLWVKMYFESLHASQDVPYRYNASKPQNQGSLLQVPGNWLGNSSHKATALKYIPQPYFA